jgi:hypothetical protein
MTREWAAVIEARVAAEEGKPVIERIADGIVGTVRALRENELFVRIVELDPELVLPYLFVRRGRSQELILSITAEAIAQGQRRREIRQGNPAALARALLLAAHGFVLSVHTMVDDDVTEEELDAELATLITRTLSG